jgi:hypothetical protein
MSRHILIALFVSLMVTLTVSRVSAAQDVTCEGTITKIEGESLTVKDMNGEKEMKIKPATKIVLVGKPVSPMDLKVGQHVKCICQWNENEMLCTTIEILKEN